MIRKAYWKIENFFDEMRNSIAFIPGVLGIAGFLFGVFMNFLEEKGVSTFLIENAPFLVINNYDTAGTLVSYMSAGIISIMVFSFSMVMLLLNQAASNFSPRVLPGLISVKKHQYILGLYLGTLLYNTYIMVGLKPTSDQYQLPGFSILLGILLTVICFFYFIYFIDSISKSIQVHSILENIFSNATTRIEKLQEEDEECNGSFDSDETWLQYGSPYSGYLISANKEGLNEFCSALNLKIHILQHEGKFLLKGMPLFKTSKSLTKEQEKKLGEFFMVNRGKETVEQNHLYGFKQITEIGVRAMSPGINDPGTAISTIDYITELLTSQVELNEDRYLYDEKGMPFAKLTTVPFADLLGQLMMSYRTYCTGDMTCSQKLIMMLKMLSALPSINTGMRKGLDHELEKLMFDLRNNIKNPHDLRALEDLYAKNYEIMHVEVN